MATRTISFKAVKLSARGRVLTDTNIWLSVGEHDIEVGHVYHAVIDPGKGLIVGLHNGNQSEEILILYDEITRLEDIIKDRITEELSKDIPVDRLDEYFETLEEFRLTELNRLQAMEAARMDKAAGMQPGRGFKVDSRDQVLTYGETARNERLRDNQRPAWHNFIKDDIELEADDFI